MLKKILSVSAFCFLVAEYSPAQPVTTSTESLELLKENLTILASDEFMGRETGTEGELLASNYISSKLNEYGIKPFGDNGAFFQNFELTEGGFKDGSGFSIIDDSGMETNFQHGVDVSYSVRKFPSKEFSNQNYRVVFAGFGVESKEKKYSDYKSVDVSGKVVLIISGVPLIDSTNQLTDEEAAKLSSTYEKYELAKSKGAAGVILIPDDNMIRRWGYMQLTAYVKGHSIKNINQDSRNNIPLLFINDNVIGDLFFGEKYSLDEIQENIENDILPVPFEMNKQVVFDYLTDTEIDTVRNIIGIIEGLDNRLKNEFVTLGAHYDHEGIKNDEIYNGADDNASGTVAVMEIARRLVELNQNKRSVLAIFHTGEEKGLLGSKYLTDNSEFIDETVVNINLDMVGRESTDSIYSVGSGKLSSELYKICESANKATVNFVFDYKYDDPADRERIYFRSDHYNYAKKGIPIVFFTDSMKDDYHKPTDDSHKINYEKIEKVCTLVTEITLRVANLDHRLTVDK